jgi:hypothetical protein
MIQHFRCVAGEVASLSLTWLIIAVAFDFSSFEFRLLWPIALYVTTCRKSNQTDRTKFLAIGYTDLVPCPVAHDRRLGPLSRWLDARFVCRSFRPEL